MIFAMMQKFSIVMFLYLALISILLVTGCDQIDDVNGSFEEAVSSPRIGVQLNDHTYRYFRFHLRQYDDAVSGTFETFDMNSYELFNQVPILMNNPLNLYYCARIDYGYVRNNTVHIVFRDKEQRLWTFIAKLGQSSLSGEIYRTRHDGIAIVEQQLDYLLPEDAAYIQSGDHPATRITLESMRDSDASLSCVYYYKSNLLHFILPESFPLDGCEPSTRQCRNFRLAIIGTHPIRQLQSSSQPFITEVLSAYLDDCDLQDNTKRSINLRDNPNIRDGINSDVFIATAIIYEDFNRDGTWNTETEPVLAFLDEQTLMFYSEVPSSSIYGESQYGTTYQAPILSQSQIDPTPGWHVYNDEADDSTAILHLRVLKHLSPATGNVLSFTTINVPTLVDLERGCYLHPQNAQQMPCVGLIPVLVR